MELALEIYLDFHWVYPSMVTNADQRKWRQIRISADQWKWRQIRISSVSCRGAIGQPAPGMPRNPLEALFPRPRLRLFRIRPPQRIPDGHRTRPWIDIPNLPVWLFSQAADVRLSLQCPQRFDNRARCFLCDILLFNFDKKQAGDVEGAGSRCKHRRYVSGNTILFFFLHGKCFSSISLVPIKKIFYSAWPVESLESHLTNFFFVVSCGSCRAQWHFQSG